MYNKNLVYFSIFFSIFGENSSTTHYMLTAEKRRAWARKSLFRLEKEGKKENYQIQSATPRKFAKFIT